MLYLFKKMISILRHLTNPSQAQREVQGSLQREELTLELKESGQSTLEFLITFAFVLGFLFSFLRIAIIYTDGYLVHYATFMASRAYMVFDNNSNTPNGSDPGAANKAQEVFDRFRLSVLIPGFDGSIQINDPESLTSPQQNLYVGAYVDFQQRLISPGLGGTRILDLRSESLLGREPTRSECLEQICRAFGSIAGGANEYCENHTTVFDNGC